MGSEEWANMQDDDQYYEQPNRPTSSDIGNRKSRWGDPDTKVFIQGVPPCIPNTLAPLEFKAMLFRIRIDEITQKISSGNLDIDTSENRSPSPPPVYDGMGKRTNTREQRTKEKLLRERQDLIQKAQRIIPSFRPPSDYRPMSTRKFRKIFIPVEKFPDYNFIGLIIGPRGLTQKKMEKDSGAKIAIRGKGSMKDGKGRMSGKMNPGDDEPLHVLLTADTEESIVKAEAMVKRLLVPVEEGQNEHKRQQLETLARINGTLRDPSTWKGEGDGKFGASIVSCSICGEISHPTRDCPMKGQGGSRLDDELSAFFGELGGESKPIRKGYTEEELDTEEHRMAFDELLAILNGTHIAPPHDMDQHYDTRWGGNSHHGHYGDHGPQGGYDHQQPWSSGPNGNSNPSSYGPSSGSPWQQSSNNSNSQYSSGGGYGGGSNHYGGGHGQSRSNSSYGPSGGWEGSNGPSHSHYGPPSGY